LVSLNLHSLPKLGGFLWFLIGSLLVPGVLKKRNFLVLPNKLTPFGGSQDLLTHSSIFPKELPRNWLLGGTFKPLLLWENFGRFPPKGLTQGFFRQLSKKRRCLNSLGFIKGNF